MRRLALARPPFFPPCRRAWLAAGLLLLAALLLAAAGNRALAQASSEAPWWVSPQGTALGPYSVAKLVALAEAGEIGARSHVWRDGMAAWARLEEVEALSAVMAAIAQAEEERGTLRLAGQLVGSWQGKGPVCATASWSASSFW